MRILLKIFPSSADPTLKDQLPRIIYISRFLFDHNNSLSPTKIELYDFYWEDPNYQLITDHPIKFPPL